MMIYSIGSICKALSGALFWLLRMEELVGLTRLVTNLLATSPHAA